LQFPGDRNFRDGEIMSSKDGKDSKESTNLFSVKNVSREFGKKRLRIFKDNRVLALNNINLEINEMDAIGIVGESGSGKTTLGRILVGLDKPTKGEVL
jgi:ABC-type oligopeptide transport system ATPase subunit